MLFNNLNLNITFISGNFESTLEMPEGLKYFIIIIIRTIFDNFIHKLTPQYLPRRRHIILFLYNF